MELLKALFESAELPADFKEKTTTLFEAAVDEKVKAEIATLTEGFQTKLEESKAQFLAESIKTIDTAIEEAILEWAKENAVGLDSEVKSQIAESFLQGLKGIFEKADIELNGDTAGKELVKLQEQNAELVKQAEESKKALTEAQEKLVHIKIKEIIAEMTAAAELADTQAHRVAKLVEAFDFKSEEDFRAKVGMVIEAVGGKIVAVNHGNQAVPAGGANVSNTVDTAAGAAGAEDGELVTKPAGASNTSAEGKTGTPEEKKDLKQPGQDAATAHMTFTPPGGAAKADESTEQDVYAPHLNADLVAETLKLFK